MDLSLYNVIIRPRVTTKVYRMNQLLQQIVLEVHPSANKPLIKEALKKIFNLDVETIRTVTWQGKVRRVRGKIVQDKKRKKAIIELKSGLNPEDAGLAGLDIQRSETIAPVAQ